MKAESGFGFWPTTWLLLNSLTSSNAEIIADDERMILPTVIAVKSGRGSERVIGKIFAAGVQADLFAFGFSGH